MKKGRKKRIAFFYRPGNKKAPVWIKRISAYIKKHKLHIEITDKQPDFLIALGGDGTILEATRQYPKKRPIIVGLNLGHVGFLASARHPKDFLRTIELLATGKFRVTKRMMASATLERKGKVIERIECLNEVTVQAVLGSIKLAVMIEGHLLQQIHGSGAMVSTSTGSTAFNLSAHGPIIMPDIKCLVLTEIHDHNIPTPSIVVKRTNTITMTVLELRKRGIFTLQRTGESVDGMFTADDLHIAPIYPGDRITVRRSNKLISFAEFEPRYFFKSLQEKFAFQ